MKHGGTARCSIAHKPFRSMSSRMENFTHSIPFEPFIDFFTQMLAAMVCCCCSVVSQCHFNDGISAFVIK